MKHKHKRPSLKNLKAAVILNLIADAQQRLVVVLRFEFELENSAIFFLFEVCQTFEPNIANLRV